MVGRHTTLSTLSMLGRLMCRLNRRAFDVAERLAVAFVCCFVILTLNYHDDLENPRSIEFMHANVIFVWRAIPKL